MEAAQVASVTPPARAWGSTMGIWGCKVLHASGAGICIFMNLASVTEIRGRRHAHDKWTGTWQKLLYSI
jgi:hypothetical protein